MGRQVFLADTSALLSVSDCIRNDALADFFEEATPLVGDSLAFPLAVKDDLLVVARDERITGWAQGLSDKIRCYTPNMQCRRWVVVNTQTRLGYDEGFSTPDGKDPAILFASACARQLISGGVSVVVVTEDIGRRLPFRPRMSQLCDAFDWPYVSMKECLVSLRLSHLMP
jgi:hypothetical protein